MSFKSKNSQGRTIAQLMFAPRGGSKRLEPIVMSLNLFILMFFLLFGLEILPPSNVLAVVTDKILRVLAHNFFFYGGAC